MGTQFNGRACLRHISVDIEVKYLIRKKKVDLIDISKANINEISEKYLREMTDELICILHRTVLPQKGNSEGIE